MAAKKSRKHGGKKKGGYKASTVKLSNKRTTKLAKQGKLKKKKKSQWDKKSGKIDQQYKPAQHNGHTENDERDLSEEDMEYYSTPQAGPGFISSANSGFLALAFEKTNSSKKRKKQDIGEETEDYEQHPRKLFADEENVKSLLPIKTKKGIIPQVAPLEQKVITSDAEMDESAGEASALEVKEQPESLPSLTNIELYANRKEKLTARKSRIATLANLLIENPEENIKKLKELRLMLDETDPDVFLTVRKLSMVSIMEVFKDIIPGYRIRLPTEAEKQQKLKQETKKMHDFEEAFLLNYKKYLEYLEVVCKGRLPIDKKTKYTKKQNDLTLTPTASQNIALLAVRCLCELLKTHPHFNYRNNIVTVLVPYLNRQSLEINNLVCTTIKSVFREDKSGEVSLEIVRCISKMVKVREFKVKREVLDTFLGLKIKEVDFESKSEKMDGKSRKEMMKKLSRRERKKKKKMELLENELLETKATEDKKKKIKMHTEIVQTIFHTYFRILKSLQKSSLLSAVLEGLSKFAHLINVEFFDDLFNVFNTLIDSGNLSYRESLHCIKTAFTILMGEGSVLNIDPMRFYNHLYNTMFKVHAGISSEDTVIVLDCVECMLGRRKRQISQQRVLAFIKRICTLCLQQEGHCGLSLLAALRGFIVTYKWSELLYDNDTQGSGVFLPELPDPEHSNAHNTMLWELTALKHHYHPVVRQFSKHLSKMAPVAGEGQLPVELTRKQPKEFLNDFNPLDLFSKSEIPEKCSVKKKGLRSTPGDFCQEELKSLIMDTYNKVNEIPLDAVKRKDSVT